MNEETIQIASLVGSNLCIASDDGEKVHDAIVAALRNGKKVRLSFEGVEDLTSAFLNTAVGQLYGEFGHWFSSMGLANQAVPRGCTGMSAQRKAPLAP